MRRTAFLFLAAASLIAATRPHYGGTLRMRARTASLDPRSASNLRSAVFEPLVTFNESGQAQPALATSWSHDADFKRWEFHLRPGVKFHDGNPLSAEIVATALDKVGAVAQGDSVVIRPQQA